MSNVLFGAVLGGVIGHMTTKESAKYALVGAAGGVLWDFVTNYVVRDAHAAPHRVHGGYVTGAVNRGGFRNSSGMPFGPGPWPTQYADAPAGM